jgi:hypothetical protein
LLWSAQNAAHRGLPNLQPAENLGFRQTGAEQFPDVSGVGEIQYGF